jgi:hypothetical protein
LTLRPSNDFTGCCHNLEFLLCSDVCIAIFVDLENAIGDDIFRNKYP